MPFTFIENFVRYSAHKEIRICGILQHKSAINSPLKDDEKGKENGGEEKDGETSETLDDKDGVINARQEEKKKKRVCESPIGEAAKRTKSSENANESKLSQCSHRSIRMAILCGLL